MTGKEAWNIISNELHELMLRRYEQSGDDNPWTQKEIEAEVLVFHTLMTLKDKPLEKHDELIVCKSYQCGYCGCQGPEMVKVECGGWKDKCDYHCP